MQCRETPDPKPYIAVLESFPSESRLTRRWTAEEALHHPWLVGVKMQSKETAPAGNKTAFRFQGLSSGLEGQT